MSINPRDPSHRAISNIRSLLSLCSDYLIVGSMIALATYCDHVFTTLLAIMVIAGRQVALTNLLHAAGHNTLFHPRVCNESAEFAFAYPILEAVNIYRGPHLEHHVEISRKLPERFQYLHDDLRLPYLGFWGRTWTVFIKGFLGYSGFQLLVSFAKDLWEYPSFAAKMFLFWTPIIGVCWACHSIRLLLTFWFLPLIWIYPVFNMWAEISDHFQAEGDTRNQVGLFNLVFLKGHELYHGLHHRFPGVPFYRMPGLYRDLTERGERIEVTSGFIDFVRIVYGSNRHPQ